MKFRISRTSQGNDTHIFWVDGDYEIESPHPRSQIEEFIYSDHRLWIDMDVVPSSQRDKWFSKGFNHRREGNELIRDCKAVGFFIDFADLDALMTFIKEVGDVVIWVRNTSLDTPVLEIYDSRRE